MKRKEQEPMHNHTTWRIGGPVDVMLQPETIEEVQEALREAKKIGNDYKYTYDVTWNYLNEIKESNKLLFLLYDY